MAWRIEYEGALYHLLSRDNERRDIFTAESRPEVKSQILSDLLNSQIKI